MEPPGLAMPSGLLPLGLEKDVETWVLLAGDILLQPPYSGGHRGPSFHSPPQAGGEQRRIIWHGVATVLVKP